MLHRKLRPQGTRRPFCGEMLLRKLRPPGVGLEQADAGEECVDRWQGEQRLRHAENKIAVAGRG